MLVIFDLAQIFASASPRGQPVNFSKHGRGRRPAKDAKAKRRAAHKRRHKAERDARRRGRSRR